MNLEFGGQITSLNLLFISIVLIIIFESLKIWKARKLHKFVYSMPGPINVPIIRDLFTALSIDDKGFLNFIRTLHDRYPSYACLWICRTLYFFVEDRQIINAVLSSSQTVKKSNNYDYFKFQSEGIFSANGDDWRTMRRIIAPSFQTKVLMSFGEIFHSNMQIFLEKIQHYADNGTTFDAYLPIHLCTMDFICGTMMGCQMDVQKNNQTKITTNLEIFTELVFERILTPFLWPDFLYKLTRKQKQMEEAVVDLRTICTEIVERRLECRNKVKSSESKSDLDAFLFLDNIIKQYESGVVTKHKVIEETVDMFVAGSLTTATTNAWVFLLLAMYPEIQEKVYQEVMEICGEGKITLEDTSKLLYMDMVLKETLRHFTVPFVTREMEKDFKVDEKITIPAGVVVAIVMAHLHQNPEYWEKPREFYPEHFLPEKVASRPKGAFIPFSFGPRICSGNKYAMMSMKFLIASTVRRFEFTTEIKPSEAFFNQKFRIMFMLWPTSRFLVKTKKRKS